VHSSNPNTTSAILNDVFHDFILALQANTRIVLYLSILLHVLVFLYQDKERGSFLQQFISRDDG
jgi:hypothetical protein